MLITFDTFKAKYPTFPSLDFIQDSYFLIDYWSSTVFAAMVEDAEEYNQPFRTEDGKFWSVITITDDFLECKLWDDDICTEGYVATIEGCDDSSYNKFLIGLEECKSLLEELHKQEPLTLEKVKALGFNND